MLDFCDMIDFLDMFDFREIFDILKIKWIQENFRTQNILKNLYHVHCSPYIYLYIVEVVHKERIRLDFIED